MRKNPFFVSALTINIFLFAFFATNTIATFIKRLGYAPLAPGAILMVLEALIYAIPLLPLFVCGLLALIFGIKNDKKALPHIFMIISGALFTLGFLSLYGVLTIVDIVQTILSIIRNAGGGYEGYYFFYEIMVILGDLVSLAFMYMIGITFIVLSVLGLVTRKLPKEKKIEETKEQPVEEETVKEELEPQAE